MYVWTYLRILLFIILVWWFFQHCVQLLRYLETENTKILGLELLYSLFIAIFNKYKHLTIELISE